MARAVEGFPVPLEQGRAPSWDATTIRRYEEFTRMVKGLLDAGVDTALTHDNHGAPDRVLIVQALMEALADVRWEFDRAEVDPQKRLRKAYEVFRCELARCGMPLQFQSQKDRARAHRRLGEMAEARGDAYAAVWHYEMALRCWKQVGVDRRLKKLNRGVE